MYFPNKKSNMTIKITRLLGSIINKILGKHQDNLGIFCWTSSDEKFLLDAEMKYYELNGISPYETSDCPKGFEQDALNFRKRLQSIKEVNEI